jgi:hypothetical protein
MQNNDVSINRAAKSSQRRDTGLIFKKIPLRLASGKTVYYWEFKLD